MRGSSVPVDDLEPVGGTAAHLASRATGRARGAAHQAQVGAEFAARGIERARPAPEAQEYVLHDVLGERGSPTMRNAAV